MKIAKKALNFAKAHNIHLGRDKNGYYIINPDTNAIVARSNYNNAKSALIMIRAFNKRPDGLKYWR